MDKVPNETHVVSVMTYKTLETEDKVSQCGFDEHVHGFKKHEDIVVGASCLDWSVAQLHAAIQYV